MPMKALGFACAFVSAMTLEGDAPGAAPSAYDPVLDGRAACTPANAGPPVLLGTLIRVKSENQPFQPVPPAPALADRPVLYDDLGTLSFDAATRSTDAQAWFDQGIRLAFAFNHAEAQRAFREAQRLDPGCALCYWGESLVLGPNINVPMFPEAIAPAMAALAEAKARAAGAPPRVRALVEALGTRYVADPGPDRSKLDAAYADAMADVARRHPDDDTIQVLYAEAMMDAQPWDYWEAGGAKPKGRGAAIVSTLEGVLARNPAHFGAVHLYIHAVEASTKPERALDGANRLGALVPGAGHIVHMPAHIYYRIGMYRESLEANKRAIAADGRYFASSKSDPLYRSAYHPHNIHFLMVSAQMGGDAATAIDAAYRLDAAIPDDLVRTFAVMEPIKASPYTTHAQFSPPATILALPAPTTGVPLVDAMYRYARAVAHARERDVDAAQVEIAALERIGRDTDFSRYADWGLPAKEIVDTARLVAMARLADAQGDLERAARTYEQAIAIQDRLTYNEPPYWYYPVRQSLGAVRLRQGRLGAAAEAFRESLLRVPNNGWALAGLVETHRRAGDNASEARARRAFRNAWFGRPGGPDLALL